MGELEQLGEAAPAGRLEPGDSVGEVGLVLGSAECFALNRRTISGRPYGIPSAVHSIRSR
jgi:hypothetical protein